MRSEAGQRYQRRNKIRPLKTRQRVKMYQSLEVSPSNKSPTPHSPLDTISRSTRDSYLLKVTKQTVINTNYSPTHQHVYRREKQPTIDQAPFERIIGDIRDEDFSLPLLPTSDHRCHKAHLKPANHSTIINEKDLHKGRRKLDNINFDKQTKRKSIIEQHERQLLRDLSLKKIISNKSTQDTYLTKNTIHDEGNQIEELKKSLDGIKKAHNFESSIGHTYGKELTKVKKIPDFYPVQQSDESFVKKSMSKPKGYMKFDKFREQITTRIDRLDPNWGMTLSYDKSDTYNPEDNHKLVHFSKTIDRQPNEVKNRYHIRQNMSLPTPQQLK